MEKSGFLVNVHEVVWSYLISEIMHHVDNHVCEIRAMGT